MKYKLDINDKDQDADEERLATLIKKAGEDARARKKEAMTRHFEKLRAVVAEAILRQEHSKPA
ncbi:MAG: hypothetical protein JRI88_02495 [Deltaproteobacteria bacterium]|nr:hypothetical protein [Deltaproteobacteria bacterium]MBW1940216.1 hypothetical protein [Deltaproteobacteria bacterium]MBW2010698.1 hypothetical protein [Deltaproteobacteria bacterium]